MKRDGYIQNRTDEQVAYCKEGLTKHRKEKPAIVKKKKEKTVQNWFPKLSRYDYMRNCIGRLEDETKEASPNIEGMKKSIWHLENYINEVKKEFNI